MGCQKFCSIPVGCTDLEKVEENQVGSWLTKFHLENDAYVCLCAVE